jgi:hypothetical protein
VEIKAVKPAELERVIVDSTVQEKAIAHPVDSRLLEIARHKVVRPPRRAGIALKQTFAGGQGTAAQGRRLRPCQAVQALKKTVKRQRTILGVVMREVQRKLDAQAQAIAAGGAPDKRLRCDGAGRAQDPARTRRAHPHPAASRQEQALRAARTRGRVHRQGGECWQTNSRCRRTNLGNPDVQIHCHSIIETPGLSAATAAARVYPEKQWKGTTSGHSHHA